MELGEKNSKKRKRTSPMDATVDRGKDRTQEIEVLESGIKQSQKNYNDIVALIHLAKEEPFHDRSPASLALCRVFVRLLVDRRLTASKGASDNNEMVAAWLRKRYKEFKVLLQSRLASDNVLAESSWDMIIRLLVEELANAGAAANSVWKNGIFTEIMDRLFQKDVLESDFEKFVTRQAVRYIDFQHHTIAWISRELKSHKTAAFITKCLNVLSAVVPPKADDIEFMYLCESSKMAMKNVSLSNQKKQGQNAWLALLRSDLQKEQRKKILNISTSSVVPWFPNVEVLMDFFTDSYNIGGATSLLALSGLFHLMQQKNLDYGDFYNKLYSLLDHNLLYSKHRSRFFRLLETFLASTHLPAAMVASFIKRLSRLALHAPPAGIVALMPWVYNMLKSHPTCTFMIHREIRTEEDHAMLEEEGAKDPFDASETDPMKTNAIDSCLWELEMLRSHYHPNVATLAGIIAEQFTKRSYNLEDFLDHSYNSLLDSELSKELKKTPVVEFEIPKTIFKQADGDSRLQELITDVFSHTS